MHDHKILTDYPQPPPSSWSQQLAGGEPPRGEFHKRHWGVDVDRRVRRRESGVWWRRRKGGGWVSPDLDPHTHPHHNLDPDLKPNSDPHPTPDPHPDAVICVDVINAPGGGGGFQHSARPWSESRL